MIDREEFCYLNALYNGSVGRSLDATDIFQKKVLKNKRIYHRLVDKGYISAENNSLTLQAMEVLAPFKVDNAVILAAGASMNFIPLSLEQPKGLFEVKGERLIERQIRQLQEAGITNITIVLGYKKEMFYYLQEKYGVKFIVNPSFNIKHNIESLYLARHELRNTYVCVSDSYFINNPFHQYEYRAFYAGFSIDEERNEVYVKTDEEGRIIKMMSGMNKGQVALGHTFWTKEFSEAFLKLVYGVRDSGIYDHTFWEELAKDNLEMLPPYYLKEYEYGNIFEFDFFDELRQFDNQYLGRTHSDIIRNIKLIFRCDEEDITDFRNISKGLTNTSFIFKIDGVDYIYRHPGDGTENIINRRNEKKSLVLANRIGIDPTYIYADVNEGWKIAKYVPSFREPDYTSFEDSKKIIQVLRKLHSSGIKTDYGMRPWEDAEEMEKLLKDKNPRCFDEYENLKGQIKKLYQMTLGDGVEKCFCHGDTYQPNWMICPDDRVILIDWEYSGYSDPGIDVGYYIVDADYDFMTAELFIKEYLQENYDEKKRFHFMAYTAIIAYYWFVWALYRESCGADIGESLDNWRNTAKRFATYLLENNK